MPDVVVYPSADELAADVAAQVLDVLAAAQQRHGRAALGLTAGSIMEHVWQALAALPDSPVDWSAVDVFWGDERYVEHDSSDRNDGPAQRILFGAAPFSSARQFSMPASDGPHGDDMDAAAVAYAATLAEARRPSDTGAVPAFDVLLLGMGPDGHCCSLFPGHPGTRDESGPVIPVRNSPKPPPNRLSLSFDGLNTADQIWVVASGSEKASAAARALSGEVDRVDVPSSGARGRSRTAWLLDADAAAKLPDSVSRSVRD